MTLDRARLGWSFGGVAALWGAIAFSAIAMSRSLQAGSILMFAAFAVPFGIGLLAKRRHPQLSAVGFFVGTIAGFAPASILFTITSGILGRENPWNLLALPVVFMVCVSCVYIGAGFSIPPQELQTNASPVLEAADRSPGSALSITHEGVERLLAFERRNLFASLGLTIAVMLFIFGRMGIFEPNPTFGVVLLVFLLGFMLHTHRRQLRQKRATWETLRISLDANTLSRHVESVPDIALPLEEVTRIQEGTLGLTVRGRDRQTIVFIPEGLEDYARVRTQLASLRDIELSSTRLRVAGSLLLFAGTVATALAFMFSQSALVVAPTGALMLALVVWSFVELGRSRLVDWRFKRVRWLFIPFAFGILAKMALSLGLWQPGS